VAAFKLCQLTVNKALPNASKGKNSPALFSFVGKVFEPFNHGILANGCGNSNPSEFCFTFINIPTFIIL